MKIEKLSFYNKINSQPKKINFHSASDITLEYALKKHSKFLPKTILKRAHELLQRGFGKMPLWKAHNEVYKGLFGAKTLEEVKIEYSDFADVKDVQTLANNRSKAIKAILKIKPLKEFTLFYLKKLYSPISQDRLVEELGFTNRNLLAWLNKRLNIKKLSGSYIQLIKMSNEKENSRISELSRRAIYADADVQKYRLERAAEAHRTPEYRAKKRQEMKDYYARNPETARKTSLISKMTWDNCPEIKKALSDYTKSLDSYTRKILSNKLAGATLTPEEKRIAYGYYKKFWEQNPKLRKIYSERRLEVIEKLKKEA